MKYLHSPFQSAGAWCDGDLYLPENIDKPPVIVLAHGLGYPRFVALMRIAMMYLETGFAVYLFDYRNFAFSEGVVRNLIDPAGQIQDLQSAVSHVRGLAEVDGSRIGLFGISFSAGGIRRGPRFFVPLFCAGLLDVTRGWLRYLRFVFL